MTTQAQKDDGIEGTWYNEHGSELTLEVLGDEELTGKFKSATGLGKGPHESSVAGFISGTLVSFVANFGKLDCLTAWTGHIVDEDGEPVLQTQWQMAVLLPHPRRAEELWRGTWVGSDVFRRQAHSQKLGGMPSHPLPEWP